MSSTLPVYRSARPHAFRAKQTSVTLYCGSYKEGKGKFCLRTGHYERDGKYAYCCILSLRGMADQGQSPAALPSGRTTGPQFTEGWVCAIPVCTGAEYPDS